MNLSTARGQVPLKIDPTKPEDAEMRRMFLDKDNDDRWIVIMPLDNTGRRLMLSIETRDDGLGWQRFTAAAIDSDGSEVLGAFEIAPAELWIQGSPLVDPEVPRWNAVEEEDFQRLPSFHAEFAAMVTAWAQVVTAVAPVMTPVEDPDYDGQPAIV